MKLYLKFINPAVSLVILALCVWAASKMDHGASPGLAGIVAGSFNSYFFAKGLFCSSMLFFTGYSLLRRLESGESRSLYRVRDVGIVGLIAVAMAGSLAYFHTHATFSEEKAAGTESSLCNPKGLEVSGLTAVPQAQFLSITGNLTNTSSRAWSAIGVEADIFHGTVFSGRVQCQVPRLNPGESRRIVLQSEVLRTDKMLDSLRYEVAVSATTDTAR